MVKHIILADLLLIARIDTTQLAKYPHVLYAKPSNKMYVIISCKIYRAIEEQNGHIYATSTASCLGSGGCG